MSHKRAGNEGADRSWTAKITDHSEAFDEISRFIIDESSGLLKSPSDIAVVGHRVVHGADKFSSAVVITQEVEVRILGLLVFSGALFFSLRVH